MKIKRYEARTEQEAIEKVKEDLGLEALILNIKKTQPKGLFAFMRKPLVEVTAAYQEKEKGNNIPMIEKNENPPAAPNLAPNLVEKTTNESPVLKAENNPKLTEAKPPEKRIIDDREVWEQQQETIRTLEERLSDRAVLLEKALEQLSLSRHHEHGPNRKYENNLVQIFYDALTEQGVDVTIAEKILEDIGTIGNDAEINLDMVVKVAYGNIMNILKQPEVLKIQKSAKGEPKIVVFIGPTGVGKTTVIAKLTSIMMLERKMQVGLITADTYRIAAVEQLRTYADILGIDVGVVYNPDDLTTNVKELGRENDIIFVDTAGRSHRNQANLKELQMLLSKIPESEKFLVLSTTTKGEDLVHIVEAYSSITDFRIIFTKLDETTSLGSILNVCYLTGKKMSYVTNGQNVPDDIEVVQPEKITKALMGLEA